MTTTVSACPNCGKTCKSKAGLTTHMNAMHGVLSPSQIEQAIKSTAKLKSTPTNPHTETPTLKEAQDACKSYYEPNNQLRDYTYGTYPTNPPTETVSDIVKQYVSSDWKPKDWNELFSKIDELFVAPIKEHKERSMHLKQQKILEIAKDQLLEKLTLRQIGELIGVSHPQQVDHHLKMLIRHRFIDKKRRVL